MKVGDLCRFKDGLVGAAAVQRCSGRTFIVLEVFKLRDGSRTTSILLDGKVEAGWGGSWIEDNSEVIGGASDDVNQAP